LPGYIKNFIEKAKAMLIAESLRLEFGQQIIFDNIGFTVQKGQKLGLVGKNGAGKSTLLKVISGTQKIDGGSISLERDCKIAYLPQEVVLNSSKSVFEEAFSTFGDIMALKEELTMLEAYVNALDGGDYDEEKLERYAHLVQEVAQHDPHALEVKVKNILTGLGFSQERVQSPVDQLSVGWKMRLVLAKLLLQNADLYLFDEPTNHLDIVTKDWFLEFLKNAEFGFMLVSHDRYFLDHACEYILDLERGKAKMYDGNYTKFLDQKEHDEALTLRAYEEQQRDIKKRMETINRFRASASRATMAQSMLKALDKIERIEVDRKQTGMGFAFPPVIRSGEVVLKLENVSKSFGDTHLFKNVNFDIFREEKIALVAANGVGKSTLLNIIMNKFPQDTGKIILGHNVTATFFEQDQEKTLDRNREILDEVESSCTTIEARGRVRAMLGGFLFPGDDAYKKIGVLSGGEKNRVAMVKVLLANANFLILDEPTNHLDLQSKEILQKALNDYKGTMLFVSHDRDFLDGLATRVLELTPTGIRSYKGNYESYLFSKREEAEKLNPPQPQKRVEPKKEAAKETVKAGSKDTYEQRKKRASLETRIEKFEKEKKELEQKFATLEWGSHDYVKAEERFKDVNRLMAKAMDEWEIFLKSVGE
jgi:ATP-binding cassette, subfamily F, member 3